MLKLFSTIGLEIHAELVTESKVFCSCSAEFGGEPNSRCCPTCQGLPGTLPVLNKKAVEYIMKAGLALNCEIPDYTEWDRKNYFYPDLPKAYQISQLSAPVCVGGYVEIEAGGKKKKIRINHIHLEEDAGKLIHDEHNTLADYNRCGVPLIEIVTEPDFHSGEEVAEFITKLRQLLMYAGVCDGKMEQGSIRCDVNISLAPENSEKLGTRTEIKNLNSIRAITRAIETEAIRQAEILGDGGKIIQETLRYNDMSGEIISLRSKENAHDYRYFPDPDIPALLISESEKNAIKAGLPEMPKARFRRYTEAWGLQSGDAEIILEDKCLSDFFDKCIACYNNPKSVAAFIVVELLRRVNLGEASIESLPFTAEDFAELQKLADTDKVSISSRKEILREMLETGKKPHEICDEKDYWIKEDFAAVEAVINEIIVANSVAVEQYKNGEQKVFGFLMGQAGKMLKGSATPRLIRETLESKLK